MMGSISHCVRQIGWKIKVQTFLLLKCSASKRQTMMGKGLDFYKEVNHFNWQSLMTLVRERHFRRQILMFFIIISGIKQKSFAQTV